MSGISNVGQSMYKELRYMSKHPEMEQEVVKAVVDSVGMDRANFFDQDLVAFFSDSKNKNIKIRLKRIFKSAPKSILIALEQAQQKASDIAQISELTGSPIETLHISHKMRAGFKNATFFDTNAQKFFRNLLERFKSDVKLNSFFDILEKNKENNLPSAHEIVDGFEFSTLPEEYVGAAKQRLSSTKPEDLTQKSLIEKQVRYLINPSMGK